MDIVFFLLFTFFAFLESHTLTGSRLWMISELSQNFAMGPPFFLGSIDMLTYSRRKPIKLFGMKKKDFLSSFFSFFIVLAVGLGWSSFGSTADNNFTEFTDALCFSLRGKRRGPWEIE